MNRILLPALFAVVLAGCGGGLAQNSALAPSPSTNPVATVPAAVPTGTDAVLTSKPLVPTAPVASPLPRVTLPTELPPQVREVVRLAQTTLGENILLSYVQTISEPYHLSADQVIYLSDLGLSGSVVNALLTHETVLAGRAAAVATTPSAATGSASDVPRNVQAEVTATQASAIATDLATAPASGSEPVVGANLNAPGPGVSGPNPTTILYGPTQPTTIVVTEPAATVIDYNTFYDSLSPYGSWVDVADYGYCWRPTVSIVDTSWQPYCHNGSWAWSDQGWYWNSGYSWGWAPFHYGRWHQSSHAGWVWQPGCDWGPAWVNWSYTGSHCAWAALPPECRWSSGVGFSWWHGGSRVSVGFGLHENCWVGIGWSDFCRPNLHNHRVPQARLTEIVSQGHSSVVGNHSQVVNINGQHNTVIINNGAPYEKVRGATRDEIRKVSIADVSRPSDAVSQVSSAARPVVSAYRPHLEANKVQPQAPSVSVLNRQRDEERKTAAAPASLSSRPNGGPVLSGAGIGSSLAPRRSDAGFGLNPSVNSGRPAAASGFVNSGVVAPLRTHDPGSLIDRIPASRSQTLPNVRSAESPGAARPSVGSAREYTSRAAVSPSIPTSPSIPSSRTATFASPTTGSTALIQDPARTQNPSITSRAEIRKPVSGVASSYGAPPVAAARSVVANSAPAAAPVYSTAPTASVTPGYSASSGISRPSYSASEPPPRLGSPSARPTPSYSTPTYRPEPAPSYSTAVPNRNYPTPTPNYSGPTAGRSYSESVPSYSAAAPSRSFSSSPPSYSPPPQVHSAPVHSASPPSSPPSHSTAGSSSGSNNKNGREH